MNDGLCVSSLKGICHLMTEFGHSFNLQRPARNTMLECLSFEKLHDNETLAVVFVNVINGADMRMIQRRSCSRFAAEALNSRMVLGKALGKKFQADVAAETNVLGLIHDPHSASAQLFQNAVMGDGSPGHRKESVHSRSS